ncbi:putative leucine-rich repeat-containing protein DDB_G0290503 isoform X2 [Hydra vulgaris]|uniref:putative leucine-rich repeat-containing protein DDB_G0290503 isoform X2 n=2 Tax=Hydra vulgaris TaxID=6087 RepID=UPI001F5EAAB1|nr:putative leucine-rich repeat-containing protein DDB_G0290503 isoform X1 [Hydra vulgaris]
MLPSQVEMRTKFEFDSNSSDEEDKKIFDKNNDNTFQEHGVSLVYENNSEPFPLFNKETIEEEKKEECFEKENTESATCFMMDVKNSSIQDTEHLDTRFENSIHIDTLSDRMVNDTVQTIVSNPNDFPLNYHSSNNKKLSNLNVYSENTTETNIVENLGNSMEDIDRRNSFKKESSDTDRVVTENDFPIFSHSGTENKKKKKKKKDELKIKLKDLATRLSVEQKMSEHLRNQIQKEINEQEKLTHKCENLQKEITLLHKDYTDQQQQYAECLRTMKEVQDAYAEKTVAVENYKQEVIELQLQLQASEGNQRLIESLRQDALDSHLLLEKLKQAHKKDVERIEEEYSKQKVSLQNEMDEFKISKQEKNNEIMKLQSTIYLLKDEVREANELTEKIKSKLEQKCLKVKKLKSEVSILNNEISGLHSSLADKGELIADLRNQLLKEAEFLTLEHDLRVKRESELEQLPILLQESQKYQDEIDQWKHQYEMKNLKVKFLKKQIKELCEQKEKTESILFILPEMQKKISALDEEKQKLEKSIEDQIYKEKEQKAQIEFEKQEKEELLKKKKEEWENKTLGIGICTHEQNIVENIPINKSLIRPVSAPLLKPKPPSSTSSKQWSKNGYRKSKNILNGNHSLEEVFTKEKTSQKNESRYLSPKYNNFIDSLNKHSLLTPKILKAVKEQKSITSRILVLGNNEEGPGKRLLTVGDRVITKLKCNCSTHSGSFEEHTGTVKFIGFVDGNDIDVYVGLRMDDEVGHTDGKIGSKRYFYCEPRRGRFVRLEDVKVFNDMQYTRPLFNTSF